MIRITIPFRTAIRRGQKIVRDGIIKGNGAVGSVTGSFAAVTYEGRSTALNNKGIFVKALIFGGNRVDFVLLNAKLGDADGDEIVSATDVFTTLSNLGAATVGGDWIKGNCDQDGLVSASDVFTALSNLGSYSPTVINGGVPSVPEPAAAAMVLMALSLSGWARRRAAR